MTNAAARRAKLVELTATETKLLRLGLDSAARDGEIRNCAVKLFESLRRRRVSADELLSERTYRTLELGGFVMPFGKHKGRPICEIDENYLWWALGNITGRPDITAAIEEFLRIATNER
jgi:hypothetical protein